MITIITTYIVEFELVQLMESNYIFSGLSIETINYCYDDLDNDKNSHSVVSLFRALAGAQAAL